MQNGAAVARRPRRGARFPGDSEVAVHASAYDRSLRLDFALKLKL
jgi:hypothetical protein